MIGHHLELGARAAYVAAGLYVALFVAFAVTPPTSLIGPFIGVLLHLVLFPAVAALPAAPWARAGGYGWLILDITSNVMTINGIEDQTTTALRLGGHVVAALWIALAAMQASRAIRYVGLPLALALGLYSLVAPWVPMTAFLPFALLLIAWLVLVGRSLTVAARRMVQASS